MTNLSNEQHDQGINEETLTLGFTFLPTLNVENKWVNWCDPQDRHVGI